MFFQRKTTIAAVCLLTLAATLVPFGMTGSEDCGSTDCIEGTVLFRTGTSRLDTTLHNNAETLSKLVSVFDSIESAPELHLQQVRFSSSASPEGSRRVNARLSRRRADALINHLKKNAELPDSLITVDDRMIDWALLRSGIELSGMPLKTEVLDIIDNTPETTVDAAGQTVSSRNLRLQKHDGGRTWRFMMRHLFPQMRNAAVKIYTVHDIAIEAPAPAEQCSVPDTTPVAETPAIALTTEETAPADTLSAPGLTQPLETKESRPLYMSLRTNMLYDALLVPNLGIEFYLGRQWSVAANWMYAWWSNSDRNRFWRIYGGDLSVRRWFGSAAQRKPLTGHHVGVYGQMLTYDFEFGGKGQMAGRPGGTLWDKMHYAFGVDYGYSLPIAERLNIDFTIGIGYMGGTYYDYEPLDDHFVWQNTKRRKWFGPTKAEISLVWLIGSRNRNAKKGGGDI